MSTPLRLAVFSADAGSSLKDHVGKFYFPFKHNIVNHPLFELDRLMRASKVLPPKNKPHIYGKVDVGKGWKQGEAQKPMSLEEAISDIEHSQSLIILKAIQHDPDYLELINQCVDEIENWTGLELRKEITWMDLDVFIASPFSVTPYHIDSEYNFHFQIVGEKQTSIFDPAIQGVISDDELERYYSGSLSAAKYRPENLAKATTLLMKPGDGVHIRPNSPHCVSYGSQYSVSGGLLLNLRQFNLRARVYQVNHYLRKFGLNPTPPGRSIARDRVKQFALGSFWKRRFNSKNELLRYGVRRIQAPLEAGEWFVQHLRTYRRARPASRT